MELMFIGAAHDVTGSCHYLKACGKNIFIDYGMQQGHCNYEQIKCPVPLSEVDYVFLTHAHIDHSGMLPYLASMGFKGKIMTTEATKDLCKIMLLDSAHIQEMEASWHNRKNERAGKPIIQPIYSINDANTAISLMEGFAYDKIIDVCEGIKIRFTDMGHLLGSASIEIFITENNISKKIVFSGDVGNINQPLIRDPMSINTADYLVIESTYGDRKHEKVLNYTKTLSDIIQCSLDKGGNLVIPSFAVGRTQELLYFIREIKEKQLIKGHEHFPVYVDSPLAIEATEIFMRHQDACYDDEALKLIRAGINPLKFEDLHLTITSEESKNINFDNVPKVIISASGMCDAGRIRHHLKHNLWRQDSTILFVGYQANGTLGRILLDGKVDRVKLFGEDVEIKANIETLHGISGHGDKNMLEAMVRQMSPAPNMVFVVHGDDKVTESFANYLHERYDYNTYAPYSGTIFDLATGKFIVEAKPIASASPTKKDSPQYTALLSAIEKLQNIAISNKSISNKDLGKFTNQVLALADKWKL